MQLQRDLGLPIDADIPLLAFVGRLDYQKGPDLILSALPKIINLGGSGCQVGGGEGTESLQLGRLQTWAAWGYKPEAGGHVVLFAKKGSIL